MKHIVLALILLILNPLFAQKKIINESNLTYNEISTLFFDNEKDTLKATHYANLYLTKANKEKSMSHVSKAYYLFSLKYNYNYDKAIYYLDKVIESSKGLKNNIFPVAAYCEKANFLFQQHKNKEAFENFLIAEKYALDNNDTDSYYEVRYQIGIFKSEQIGEVAEAINLYKECYDYIKTKDLTNPKYYYQYHNIVFALADGYSSIGKYDLASRYDKIGHNSSVKNKDEEMQYLFVLNEGAVQAKIGNYKVAFDSVTKALPKMKTLSNIGSNLLASYYYLGKIYEKTNRFKLAETYYVKVDSIYETNKDITPEFLDGYTFLINYYKSKNEKENQLKYLNRFIEIDRDFRKKYIQWNQLLKYKYDIPHLVKEREDIIHKLKNDKEKNHLVLLILIVTILLILGYIFYLIRQRKADKIKFEKLIDQLSENQTKYNIAKIPENSKEIETEIGISKEIINKILEKFKEFEEEKLFLKKDVSLISLSKKFETNSSYISKIINAYSKKSLINYINDLRIDFVVLELQQNKSLRKYTINAISEEIGFSNPESFSKAFYKKTGLKPSYFIKELEKNENVII